MSWWQKFCDPYSRQPESHTDKRNTLVVYDIVDNKRRYRLHKALKSFGIRVQKSAFECQLDEAQYQRMMKKIVPIIDQSEDLLRVYRLTQKCDIFCLGNIGRLENEDDFWIV